MKLSLVLSVFILLAACGQAGPLFLPQETPQQGK